eukprot:3289303-Prymnesium_polylepis.2
MYTHPKRTRSLDLADVHVLGLSTTASMFVHNRTDGRGAPVAHWARIAAVARALSESGTPLAAVWANQSCRVLLLAPSDDSIEGQLSRPLAQLMLARPNVQARALTCATGGLHTRV